MGSLLKIAKSRMFLAFLGIVFMSLFIWFAGPLLGYNGQAPLESAYNRIIAIGGLSAFWLFTLLFRFIKSRRKNAQMLNSIVADVSPGDAASAEELAILQNKMQQAVDTLKKRNFSKKGGSRFIYELPWYVIIGPPGAGKTTLLSNSGLDFPLEETHGKFSVKGVGGTRNCDWWFTDQAVLLDTAGRYTTQDSEAEVDKSAWSGFLNLLKEKRSRRPINGVLLALSIQDIVQSDDDALAQIAKVLRARIDELYNLLGIAPPVYLMFTKCDLLAGFNEYFSDLDRQDREQIWGFTLPLDLDTDTSDFVDSELDELAGILNSQTTAKMHRELSQRNRENIYSFPMQFSFAQQRVRYFVQHLTNRSRLLENILFRGVYFTSATQTGSVLDQVIQNVSRSFGINETIESTQTDSGKSYFIHQLLSDVVFGESGLAGTNLKTERKLAIMQIVFASIVGITLLSILSIWGTSFVKNRNAVTRIESEASALQQSLAALPADSLDLFKTNFVLNNARHLGYLSPEQEPNENGFLVKNVGLYQGNKIGGFAANKYDELLIDTLLARLMVRLEHQMHAKSDDSEFLFEALKTYQMIEDRAHFDADAIIGWFNFDFDSNLPGDTPTQVRISLKQHVAELFRERPFRLPRPLDQGLVFQYQQLAANVSLEQRAYNRIKNTAQANLNSFFKLTTNAGPEVPLVFSRSDDVSLDQSIPKLFTLEGFHSSFVPASKNISRTLADDSWVLGDAVTASTEKLTSQQLEQSVNQQYFDDYIKTWETLIQALELKPVDGLGTASEFVSLITDVDSPLKNLLVLIGDQTILTKPEPDEDGSADESASKTSRENQLGSILNNKDNPVKAIADIPIDPVTTHFSTLHKLVENWETNASQLDQVLNQLAEVNLQLLPMAQSPGGAIDTKLGTELAVTLKKLTSKAGRLPQPLSSLVEGLTNEINDVVGGGFCQQLSSAWKTDVFTYYKRAISNRYPVNRNGTTDIALTDFGAFFGPNGIIDSFVNTFLASLVSKTPGQWTWVGTGSAVCLSDNTLKQLAFADDIKNTFFAQGGSLPAFRFDVVPERLIVSDEIDQLFLDIGGNRMEFFHGPISGVTSFSWPGVSNNSQVSLRVEPVIPGASSSIALSGPWAVLRLFDQGSRTRARGGLTVDYSFSGRSVSMTLASSSFNPLNSVAVRNFRCPENL